MQAQAHGPVQWFQFDWSDDYERLQASFQQVQATNDPNMLVVFLSRHPYHIDAALQLAMVFARTGNSFMLFVLLVSMGADHHFGWKVKWIERLT